MLQSNQLKYSKIQKVHSFVNYIMLNVILNAKNIGAATFDSSLVIAKYKSLIDGTNKKYILTPLKSMYLIAKTLPPKDIKTLKKAVHNNNRIRELCNGDIEPIRYRDIEVIDGILAKAVKSFCDALYDHCLGLAGFSQLYETTDAYYKNLVGRKRTCPACGVHKILNRFHSHRSALDHYLPKSIYPFVSVNFHNLVPVCDNCNSKYKLAKDTLEIISGKKSKRSRAKTKAFYPFSSNQHIIDIEIKFIKKYHNAIEPKDIQITLTNAACQDKVANWDRIFGITENYNAECCSDTMITYYEEYFAALKNRGITLTQHVEDLERNKYNDSNFLKIPFLKAI